MIQNKIKAEGVKNSPGKKLILGLVGFGVVGKGLYDILAVTPGLDARIKKICIKDPKKLRAAPHALFTTNFELLLQDEEINVIVELIDDADAAFDMVKASLLKGKAVVSANKKMIAAHFKELLDLQQRTGTAFLYEAACCAGIPIIRNLEEYYDNDMLSRVRGIINGSTNFILTKIIEEGLDFSAALKLAQEKGFAESDPALDIEGKDAANKLAILAAHAFGTVILPKRILYAGITAITSGDALLAAEKNCSIRLVADARKLPNDELAVFVLPQLVPEKDDLFNVRNEFNALETETAFADRHFFKGKGAGAFPTAAAVLSDIAALRYDYKYEYKKRRSALLPSHTNDYVLSIIVTAPQIQLIPLNQFIKISSIHTDQKTAVVKGTINAASLFTDRWWQGKNISLLLEENCFEMQAGLFTTELIAAKTEEGEPVE